MAPPQVIISQPQPQTDNSYFSLCQLYSLCIRFPIIEIMLIIFAEIGINESKTCPLQSVYDAEIHDAVANMRRLDGPIPVYSKYGAPVNFFTPVGIRKYWVKSSTPVLGHLLWYIVPFMYFIKKQYVTVLNMNIVHLIDDIF